MSERYPGGLITKTPVTPSGPYETSTASGVWTLDQQAYWQKLGQWPSAGNQAPDAQFNYVTMLLHGDGTNGAQNNTFLDSSSNTRTITRTGTPTQGSFSPYGSNWSNYFDGSGDWLRLNGQTEFAFGTGDFTIEGWFNASDVSTTMTLYDSRPTSTSGTYPTIIIQTQLKYFTDSNTLNISGSTTIQAGVWYHFAVVRNSTTTTLYLNGVSEGSASDSYNYLNGSQRPTIGTQGFGTANQNYNGYLSNVRVVKGSAVYTSNFTPSTTPLTAITNTSLLTCQSNRFIDNSANNFAITINGETSVQRFNPFGASTAYSTSVIGGSGYFDTGNYLSVSTLGTASSGVPYCIEMWVYPTSFRGSGEMRLCGAGTNDPLLQFSSNTDLQFFVGNSLVTSYTTTFKTNQWYHIAVTRNSSNSAVMYLNGVSVSTATSSATLNTSTFLVGAQPTSPSIGLIGYMTDFRAVLGSVVYSSNFTPPTAPLTDITNTSLLCNFTNGAIYDNAMMNDLETVGNAQISTSVVKYGTGSLKFDGSNDYLYQPSSLALNFSTGDFTVEFWIYPNNWTGTYKGIIATTTTNAFWLGKNVSNFALQAYGSANIVAYSTFPTTGTWTHIAITRSGTSVIMFYNGTQVATGTSSASFALGNLYVGADGGGGDFDGYIDDLRITKGYARYTANFTPPTQAFQNTGPT